MQEFYRFETDRFAIVGTALEPSEPIEFMDDEEREAYENGEFIVFDALVEVHLYVNFKGYKTAHVIATDVLGDCRYASLEEFASSHRDPDPMNRNCEAMRGQQGDNVVICHYFPGIVREAVAYAREALASNPKLRA